MAGRTLIISDLHVGVEERLFSRGVRLGAVSDGMLESIRRIARENGIKRIAITGDVKERIEAPDAQAMEFFAKLSRIGKVIVARGNHDGGIERIPGIEVIGAQGGIIRAGGMKIGLFHGHAAPDAKLLGCDAIFCGHEHPTVEMANEFGGVSRFHAWIRVPIDYARAKKAYARANRRCAAYIVPPFNPALGGQALNRRGAAMMGPAFKNGIFKLSGAEIIMLEGASLGALFEAKKGEKITVTKNR
ncbi:MAG: metallophosphoesterase [Candidatus Micrarchaeia archaeon]